MNPLMLDFMLKVVDIDVPGGLHMRAPKGATISDPLRGGRGHVGEMARRFPSSSYAYHPELTTYGGGLGAFVYHNPFATQMMFGALALWAVTYPLEVALMEDIVSTESVSTVEKITFLQGVSYKGY